MLKIHRTKFGTHIELPSVVANIIKPFVYRTTPVPKGITTDKHDHVYDSVYLTVGMAIRDGEEKFAPWSLDSLVLHIISPNTNHPWMAMTDSAVVMDAHEHQEHTVNGKALSAAV